MSTESSPLYPPFFDKRGREWEWFSDPSYYDMTCVRVNGERNFDSPLAFHFDTYETAKKFCKLLIVSS